VTDTPKSAPSAKPALNVDPATLAQLKAKHSKLRHYTPVGEDAPILYRPCTRVEYQCYLDSGGFDGEGPPAAAARAALAMDCIVYPSVEALGALLDRRPAALLQVSQHILRQAGQDARAQEGEV
jgi:hypothetical protein